MASRSVVEALSAAWDDGWSETPPLAFLLRSAYPDRWVRFHSLPASKRYAETEAERAEILSRHHAVLDALGPSSRLFVISTRFASDHPNSVRITDGLLWRTIEASEYFEELAQVYVTSIAYPSIEFDDVLRAAADWQLANVIIGPPALQWLYHPLRWRRGRHRGDDSSTRPAQSPVRRVALRPPRWSLARLFLGVSLRTLAQARP
jgi:hypothetical protein